MPYVKKNENSKKGVTYRVQYTFFDEATQKRKTKVETFEPPSGLSAAEAHKAAYDYGIKLERQTKELAKNKVNIPLTVKVKELAPLYLEYLKKNRKLSYYKTAKDSFAFVLPRMGNVRVMDVTPLIIQNWIDWMDTQTYVKTQITATGLADAMDEQKMSMAKLARLSGCSISTVKKARCGGNMDRNIVENIASALKVELNQLFKITETVLPYSYSMKDKGLTALSGLFGFAVRNLIIEKNYAEAKYVIGFEKTEKEKEGKPYLQDYEVLELLSKIKQEPDIRRRLTITLAIMMEYRRGEIAGLEWDDIDLDSGEIMIRRESIVIGEYGICEEKPKSKTSERKGCLPKELIELLTEYKKWWVDFTKNLGDRYDGTQRLFLQANGKPIYPTTLYEWTRKLEKKYGVTMVSMHSLRASSITMQNDSGLIKLEEIAEDAGHADTQVTIDHYVKTMSSKLQRIAEAKSKVFNIAK